MYEDLIVSVASVVVLALVTGAWLLSRHLRDAKLVRLREMAHRERIVSLERGLESAVPRPEDFELEPRRPFPWIARCLVLASCSPAAASARWPLSA
jgi:hypothetical protein